MEKEIKLAPEPQQKNRWGIVPKSAMVDPELPIYAKGIYAYFCASTDINFEGDRCYSAHIRTILEDLGISSGTFYRHLATLQDQGYITVLKRTSLKGVSSYIIESTPSKYLAQPPDRTQAQRYAYVKNYGIYASGCGNLPLSVMTNHNLDLKARTMYAYLAACDSLETETRPCEYDMAEALCIGSVAVRKYRKQLFNAHYIQRKNWKTFETIEQRKKGDDQFAE